MKVPFDDVKSTHLINDVFLAFIPEGSAGFAVDEIAKQQKAEHHLTGNPLGMPQYHLSLISIGTFGPIPADLVSSLGEVFAPLAAATEPIQMSLDRARSVDVQRSKLPFVLNSSSTNKPLLEFYRKLTPRGQGKRKPLRPHVTMIWDTKFVPERIVPPVCWTATKLVLVHSYYGLGKHEHLASWPLLGKSTRFTQMDFPMSLN